MTVYADYAAAAPLRPEARAAMVAALDAGLGNPSSVHGAGARARAWLERAREEVAAALGVHPLEIVFTSGATEANNLALAGLGDLALVGVGGTMDRARRFAAPATEHASVLEPLRALAMRGHDVTLLAVDAAGRTSPEHVRTAAPDVLSVALANAEMGVVQDVLALAAAARETGAVVHVDAAQALGVCGLDGAAFDLVTVSSTKVGGPAGAGALVVRRGTQLAPVLRGGPQEQGMRAGTENVAAIVGFAAALATAVTTRATETARLAMLRDRLRTAIAGAWPGARFTLAADVPTAPHLTHCTLPGVAGEDVVAALDLAGVAAATGSACAAGAAEPSHVLLAMGHDDTSARASLRLSLGWASTAAHVDAILQALARVRTRIPRRAEVAA